MAKKKPAGTKPAKKPVNKKAQAEQVEVPGAYRWPEGVPVNRETLALAAEDFQIFVEGYNLPVLEDDDQDEWYSGDTEDRPFQKKCERDQIRELVKTQANCKRALALYEIYVTPDCECRLTPRKPKADEIQKEVFRQSELAFREFRQATFNGWSVQEFTRRIYRDGEQFTRKFTPDWPPQLRFIDPEHIRDEHGDETKGIVTQPEDVATPIAYLRLDTDPELSPQKPERIPAEDVFHSKIDSDSTEKRGRSRFSVVNKTACMLRAMVRNEVYLRNAQSSIILVRKVAGGSTAVNRVTDNAKTGVTEYSTGSVNREKFRPGTILTVSKGVEVDFAQPQSNFSDASPLIKILIQQICAATGFSYTMVSADSSDTNASSGLVAESPVVQMVKNERTFLTASLHQIFKFVFESAVAAGRIEGVTPENLWTDWTLDIQFADIVSRDPLADAQVVNIGVMTQSLSRKEASRRLKADPDLMRAEIEEESKLEYLTAGMNGGQSSMNPDMADKKKSSDSNATKGRGTNQ